MPLSRSLTATALAAAAAASLVLPGGAPAHRAAAAVAPSASVGVAPSSLGRILVDSHGDVGEVVRGGRLNVRLALEHLSVRRG